MPRLLILADYAPNVVARASNAQLGYTEMMQKLHSTVYDRSKYLLKHFGQKRLVMVVLLIVEQLLMLQVQTVRGQ